LTTARYVAFTRDMTASRTKLQEFVDSVSAILNIEQEAARRGRDPWEWFSSDEISGEMRGAAGEIRTRSLPAREEQPKLRGLIEQAAQSGEARLAILSGSTLHEPTLSARFDADAEKIIEAEKAMTAS
jgi:hypothetical protein